MLFHFQLSPVERIAPWVTPSRGNEKSLHWFGLTDGCYWLEVDGAELFRYSPAVVEHWVRTYPDDGCGPYVNYYVVRLWEDVLEMLPAVLEPVPDDLARYVRPGGPWESWAAWQSWSDRAHAWMDTAGEASWEVFCLATHWWGARQLGAAYLSAAPGIWFWREADRVCVRWDNRDIFLEEMPAWATQSGGAGLTAAEFTEEVRLFNERLIRAMAERVDAVRTDWPHPEVRLDWEGLRLDHRQRSEWFSNALARSPLRTGWADVRAALAEISRHVAETVP